MNRTAKQKIGRQKCLEFIWISNSSSQVINLPVSTGNHWRSSITKKASNLSLARISKSVKITVIWPNKSRHASAFRHPNDHVSKQFDKIIYLSDRKSAIGFGSVRNRIVLLSLIINYRCCVASKESAIDHCVWQVVCVSMVYQNHSENY